MKILRFHEFCSILEILGIYLVKWRFRGLFNYNPPKYSQKVFSIESLKISPLKLIR